MYVYGPWVLIRLLGFGADTMALLAVAGAGIGIFFIPAVGRWIDRFGAARIMMVEAGAFFLVYIAYGFLSGHIHNARLEHAASGLLIENFAAAGIVVILAFGLKMLDFMTIQFGLVRSVYMRRIAVSDEDVTPTLSLGLSIDHILSILSAVLCGWLWHEFGPQFVFVFAAVLAVANMIVAKYCSKIEAKITEAKKENNS
jgi:MFS family permease